MFWVSPIDTVWGGSGGDDVDVVRWVRVSARVDSMDASPEFRTFPSESGCRVLPTECGGRKAVCGCGGSDSRDVAKDGIGTCALASRKVPVESAVLYGLY